MNIKYLREMSDLHLEFGPFHIPELPTDSETVLLLPGDIHVGARSLQNGWLVNLSKRFAYVLCVLGNHEHYKSSLDVTGRKIREGLAKHQVTNVHLLENESFVIPGTNVKVIGGTMWTDFNKGHPVTIYSAERTMNDYRKIRTWNYNRRLTAQHILGLHIQFKEYLKRELASSDHTVIVMSHHAPHEYSCDPMYSHPSNYHDNGCYFSDLSDLILDHPQIKLWFHGHTHNNSDYMIGDDCRVICNPRGYHDHSVNDDFNPLFMLELPTTAP